MQSILAVFQVEITFFWWGKLLISFFFCSTQEIDERLGFFQTNFKLSGQEVRQLAVKQPKVITGDLEIVKVNKFVIKEEMGFSDTEIKKMILEKPKILMKCKLLIGLFCLTFYWIVYSFF